MSGRPLEVLLHHIPGVIASAENEWTRGFAKSVLRQSRNPNWKPSPKQDAIMQRMVAETLRENDVVVIEDADD